jgi:hypothetical protein
MNRAADFGAVAAALWAAHDLGDHIVQTDHQAADKATSWRAMTGHIAGYTATQIGALAAIRTLLGVRPSFRRVAAAVLFSAATHAIIDRRWPVKALLRATRSPRFAEMLTPICGPYQADQALHHGCLLVSALVMTANRSHAQSGTERTL